MLDRPMRWLVADSLYNADARWRGHLDSWSHYLREYGEDVDEVVLDGSDTLNAGADYDVALFLDGYSHWANFPCKVRVAFCNTLPALAPWMLRDEMGPQYDLILSAIPALVAHARSVGCRAEQLDLAFDTRALVAGMGVERKPECITIGSTTVNAHHVRSQMLAQLSAAGLVKIVSPTFGRAYFAALAGAAVVWNCHASWSFGSMMNMRVYESTGMGCQLVTDGDDGGRWGDEVFRYNPGDLSTCAARIHEALLTAQTAKRTAAQARCLTEHTYEKRIPRLVQLVKEVLDARPVR